MRNLDKSMAVICDPSTSCTSLYVPAHFNDHGHSTSQSGCEPVSNGERRRTVLVLSHILHATNMDRCLHTSHSLVTIHWSLWHRDLLRSASADMTPTQTITEHLVYDGMVALSVHQSFKALYNSGQHQSIYVPERPVSWKKILDRTQLYQGSSQYIKTGSPFCFQVLPTSRAYFPMAAIHQLERPCTYQLYHGQISRS